MKPIELNRAEVWVADHVRPIFLGIATAIVLCSVAVFVTYERQGEVEQQVNVLRPQVTRVNKAICDRESLGHPARAHRCAERIRVGLINCRRSDPCRAAFLAVATYPPPARPTAPSSTTVPKTRGGAAQPSHHGHQQPGPGSPGHHGGGQEPSPGPSPAPSPSPAPEPGPVAESPGNGAQGGSTSGAGVEVCVEIVNTCLGVAPGH
jgi:hypothetical protein